MRDLTTYTQEVLSNIKQSKFLSDDDWGFLVKHKPDFQEIFEKKKIWRTSVDMEVSVLSDVKYPDNAAKYWQCVRECDAFYNYLIELSFEFRRNQVKLESLNRQIDKCTDDLQLELLTIDREELNYIISNQTKQAKERVRELKEWIRLMNKYNDNSFNPADQEQSQLLSYARSFIKKFDITKDSVSGSERTNLVGLLVTSLNKCAELDIMDDLYKSLTKEEVGLISQFKINKEQKDNGNKQK